MTWLLDFFKASGYATIQSGGTPLPKETILNFQSGAVVTDDAFNERTVVTITTGAVVPTGTGFFHITGSVADSAARAVNLATSDVTGVLPYVNGGTGLSAVGTNGYVLTVVSGAPAWALNSPVTWTNDLASSSLTHQWVSGISGSGGTGGNVSVGDGVHAVEFNGVTNLQVTPAGIGFNAGAGYAAASTAGAGSSLGFTGGLGATPTSGTAAGGAGGGFSLQAGNGGNGLGSNQNSGAGGNIVINAGVAGTPTGSGVSGTEGTITLGVNGELGLAIDYGVTTASTYTFTFGDGLSNTVWAPVQPARQSTPPTITYQSYQGYSATLVAGGAGGAFNITGGAGGAGQGTNHTGGAGAAINITGGAGGAATGNANNSNGGNIVLTPGAVGTGGSGSAGFTGSVIVTGFGAGVVCSSSGGALLVEPYSTGYLFSNGSAAFFQPITGQVTGTGLWFSASGTLDAAAATLTGDVSQGSLSGNNVPLTVTKLQGFTVSASTPSGGNILLYGGSSAWVPTTMSGDVTITNAGVTTLGAIQGISVPTPSGSNTVLTYNSGALTWGSSGGGSSVTGTGLWYSTTGSLHSAAITLTGDVSQGALSTNNLPLTVTALQTFAVNSGTPSSAELLIFHSSAWTPTAVSGDATISSTGVVTVGAIQGNTVTSGALTKGQFFVASTTSNWAATSLSGDVSESATTAGKLTVTGLNGVSLPAGSGTNTVLQYNAGAYSWVTQAVAPSVTGTGLWYSTSGTLNSAAITFNGDVSQGALSGSNVPLTVTALQGNFVSAGSLTTGQFLVASATPNEWDPATISGDVSSSAVSAGKLTVTAIQSQNVSASTPSSANILVYHSLTWTPTAMSGDVTISSTGVTTLGAIDGVALPSPSGSSTVLTYNAGALSWASSGGSGVSWANDLSGSNNTHQYVIGLDGNGTGAVSLGTGAVNLALTQTTSTQTTPPTLSISSSTGYAAASTSGAGGAFGITAGSATVASSGTAAGAAGGALTIASGTGAAGLGTNQNGGNGGAIILNAGLGGARTGSGTAGSNGAIDLQFGGTTYGAYTYSATTGTLTFATGQTNHTISVTSPENLNLAVLQAPSPTASGGAINITSGAANALNTGAGPNPGGGINLTGGQGGGASGAGNVSGNGGDIKFTTGLAGGVVSGGTSGTNGRIVFTTGTTGYPNLSLDYGVTTATTTTVLFGDSVNNTVIAQSVVETTLGVPTFTIQSAAGGNIGGGTTNSAGCPFYITAGSGSTPGSGTQAGAVGGALTITSGTGAAGIGTNQNGGNAGNIILNTGAGGAKTGSGTAGTAGVIDLQINGTTYLAISATGTVTLASLGTGVVQSSSAGLLTSSIGTSAQLLLTNSGATAAAWVSMSGDVTITASGATTLAAIDGKTLPSPSGTGTVLTYSGSTLSWASVPATSVTGTGLWYSATGTLNSAAITLTGDITQGSLSSNNLSLTVSAIQGNTVTSGALTKGQFFVASTTSNWAATTLSGDLSESATTAGKVTVTGINGTTVPAGGSLTTGNQLIVSGASALSYAALNLAGGSGYVTGALPVTNIANGTNAQLLVTNSGATAPAWVSLSGDSSITAAGAMTNTAIQGNTVTSGALTKGQFFVASSTTNWAATSLSGDVSESGVTAGLLTVVGIQGNTVTSGALTKGTFLIATTTSNWASTALSGDVSESAVTPGLLTVVGLNGVSLPAGSGTDTVLQFNAGAYSWAAAGGSVTWANDLSGSSSTNQWVIGLDGNGTGAVTLGTNSVNLALTQKASGQSTPPTLILASSAGFGAASASGAGGKFTVTSGAGTVASSGTANGGAGGILLLETGNGAAALGAASRGGAGGALNITAGNGGASTTSSANSNGGSITITLGSPGSGGSGTAGTSGTFTLKNGGGNTLISANGGASDVFAMGFTTSNATNYNAGSITINGLPGDTASNNYSITAQAAHSGAVTNVNGGLLILAGGASALNGTTGLRGGVLMQIGGDTAETMLQVGEVIVGQRVVALAQLGSGITSTQVPASAGDGIVWVGNAHTNPTAAPASGFTIWSATGFPNVYVPGAANAQLLGQSGTQGGAINKLAKTIYNLTTTATGAQTIATIAVPASETLSIMVRCAGRLTAAAFTPYFNVGFATVANNAGTLSTVQSTLLTAMPASAGATLSFTTSGTNLLVQIAPNAVTSTTWEAVIDIITT